MATYHNMEEDAPHEAYAKTKPEVLKACIMCENAGHLACAVCGTKYCSQPCQKQDWKHHKMLCRSSVGTEFRLDNRPGPDYRRIIVFPVDQKRPAWEWARFQGGQEGLAYGEYRRLIKCPSDDKFIHLGIPLNSLNLNPYLRFGRGLHLFAVGETNADGVGNLSCRLDMNQSILHLAAPGRAQPYFGPYAVAAFSSDEIGRPIVDRGIVWEDATLKDLRLVVDSRITARWNPCIVDPDRFVLNIDKPEAQIWPALKLNCEGDMQRFGLTDAIEDVFVSSGRGQRTRYDCHIANVLGLSWIFEMASTNGSISGNRELLRTGQDFGQLFKRVDLPDDITPYNLREVIRSTLRKQLRGDTSYVGTILLMHKQGRAICRTYLQAVMAFKDFVWAEGIEGLETGRLSRNPFNFDYLDRSLTREKFEAYWNEKWADSGVPSPYTLED